MTETTTGENAEEEEVTTTEPIACSNPVVDAARSIASAAGQDITCDKARGYLLMIGIVIVLIIVIKVFLLKK
jgi:hypothetical protein